MKSISAAIIVLAGVALFYIGYGVHPAEFPPNLFQDAPWTKRMGIALIVVGLIVWIMMLARENKPKD